MDTYEKLATYYDLIYFDTDDLDFYLNEAKNARGPVLEVACGTGRILLKLIGNGIDATGLDLSNSMLDVLRRKATALGLEPHVLQADMTNFKIRKKFNLIIVPYRSFLHLRTASERAAALKNFHDHLDSGGRLIMHTYNPSADEMVMVDDYHLYDTEKLKTPKGRSYTIEWYLRYNPQIKVGNYKITLRLSEEETYDFFMDVSFIPVKELQSMLKKAVFHNIKTYCGFNYSEYTENCKEALFIAEK